METYWWKNVYRDAEEYVKSCDECQRRIKIRVEEELHPNLTSTMWHRVLVDVVHMPIGVGERKYLVVAREDVSGWPEARAIRKANGQTVANFLKEDVFARHGCPTSIIVDGGSENKGEVDIICNQLGVKKHMITAYHPQANGVVEQGHKQLVNGLSKACSGKSPAKWPEYLNDVLWADRITVRKSTGFSPFELVYGRKCLLPIEVIFSTWQIVEAHEPRTTQQLINLRVAQLTQSAFD